MSGFTYVFCSKYKQKPDRPFSDIAVTTVAMPNGYRVSPYRISQGVIAFHGVPPYRISQSDESPSRRDEAPSPDSDHTDFADPLYRVRTATMRIYVERKFYMRWRQNTKKERQSRALLYNKLVPSEIRCEWASKTIAQFLG